MKKAKSHSEGHQYHTTQSERSWLELRRFSSSVSWAEKLLAYRLSSSATEVIEEEKDSDQEKEQGTSTSTEKVMETSSTQGLDVITDYSNMSRFYPERKLQYGKRSDTLRFGTDHDESGIRSPQYQSNHHENAPFSHPISDRKRTSVNYYKREFSLHHRQLWCEPTGDPFSTYPRQSIIVRPHPNMQDLEEKPLPPSPTSTYSQDSIDESEEWSTNLKSYWSDDSDSSDEEGELTVTQERLSRKLQASHDDLHLSQRVISTWKGLRSRKMSVPNLKSKQNDQQMSPKAKTSHPIPTLRTYPPSATGKHSSMPRPEIQRFSSSSSFKQKRVNLSEVHISPPKEWRGLQDL